MKTQLLKELKRFFPLIAIAALILVPDTGSYVVLYALGITVVIAAISHLIRKILFPYIDLESVANKATETPMGAALVFASVSGLLAVIITATCNLLR